MSNNRQYETFVLSSHGGGLGINPRRRDKFMLPINFRIIMRCTPGPVQCTGYDTLAYLFFVSDESLDHASIDKLKTVDRLMTAMDTSYMCVALGNTEPFRWVPELIIENEDLTFTSGLMRNPISFNKINIMPRWSSDRRRYIEKGDIEKITDLSSKIYMAMEKRRMLDDTRDNLLNRLIRPGYFTDISQTKYIVLPDVNGSDDDPHFYSITNLLEKKNRYHQLHPKHSDVNTLYLSDVVYFLRRTFPTHVHITLFVNACTSDAADVPMLTINEYERLTQQERTQQERTQQKWL